MPAVPPDSTPAEDRAATIILTVRVSPEHHADYFAWQERVNRAAAEFPGFEHAQVNASQSGDQGDSVTVLYRFRTSHALRAWLDSDERRALLEEAGGRWEDVTQVAAASPDEQPGVTLVVTHTVPQENVEEFLAEQDRIQQVESTFPGYLGVSLLEPVPGVQPVWTSLVRFDTRENLEQWLNSKDRKEITGILSESGTDYETKVVDESFGSWFSFNKRDGRATPNWKQWLTVLLVLYPTVMLLGFVTDFAPGGAENTDFPPAQWFFANMWIGNLLSTFLLAFVLMPLVNRALTWWLKPGVAVMVTIWGTLLMVALFLASMGIFKIICESGCSF